MNGTGLIVYVESRGIINSCVIVVEKLGISCSKENVFSVGVLVEMKIEVYKEGWGWGMEWDWGRDGWTDGSEFESRMRPRPKVHRARATPAYLPTTSYIHTYYLARYQKRMRENAHQAKRHRRGGDWRRLQTTGSQPAVSLSSRQSGVPWSALRCMVQCKAALCNCALSYH